MGKLPFSHVHLDFHTSGAIEGIGEAFDKTEFQETLKAGHVNSITLFSKGHHGWSYHETSANRMHPNLRFDLLTAQIEACKEIGVRTPIYISAGIDEKEANKHPEWVIKPTPDAPVDFLTSAGFHLLCFNTPYMDQLEAQVEEVMQKFHPTEIFLDICDVRVCYCNHCIQSMYERGMDPQNPDDVKAWGEIVYKNYAQRIENAVRKYDPDCAVFHNAGRIMFGRPDIFGYNTHLELESLPTGGWGYDHFPLTAAYSRTVDREYLGMTGKFHGTWGEFGGFKHPNALRYETALSISLGAKCSIGDQLHPSGKINRSTYDLIGAAYKEVEEKEPWCDDVTAVVDVAVISAAAANNRVEPGMDPADVGANRILLEKKYLYDFIDLNGDFGKYKLLILPDTVKVDSPLKERLQTYLDNGGKLLLSGISGTGDGKGRILNTTITVGDKNTFSPNYFVPASADGFVNGITQYVMFTDNYHVDAEEDFEILGNVTDPYFNRTPFHFCSHQHTPDRPGTGRPAVLCGENIGYIAWNVFSEYATNGMLHLKEMVSLLLDRLIGTRRTVRVSNFPDRGVVTLLKQEKENRLVNHLLFAHTSVRGTDTEVIEDTVPLYEIAVEIKCNCPKTVRLVPQGTELPFNYENGTVSYTVPKLDIHQMIEIAF